MKESKRESNRISIHKTSSHERDGCLFFGVNTQTGKPSKMISYEGAICVQNIYDSHNLCNSHEILHFAASLIEGRTEVSIVKRFFCSMDRSIMVHSTVVLLNTTRSFLYTFLYYTTKPNPSPKDCYTLREG